MSCRCGHEDGEAAALESLVCPPRISDEARRQALARLAESGHEALRLVVDKQHQHELFADARRESDLVLDLDGLALLVDVKTAGRISGLYIDYVRADGVEGFVLQDPDAPPRASSLTLERLGEWLAGGKSVTLFDVRLDATSDDPPVYAEARKLDAEGRALLGSLDPDAPIVFLATHRERAWAAAGHACQVGHRHVFACATSRAG